MSKRNSPYKTRLEKIINALPQFWAVVEKAKPFNIYQLHNTAVLLPKQGWKIHVSAQAHEGLQLLNLIPKLINYQCSIKIVGQEKDILSINSGEDNFTHIGKILTIYPINNKETIIIGKFINNIWNSPTAPRPPSDILLNPESNVSFRYGSFSPQEFNNDKKTPKPVIIDPYRGIKHVDIPSIDGSQPNWAPTLPIVSKYTCEYNIDISKTVEKITPERFFFICKLSQKPFTTVHLVFDKKSYLLVVLKVYRKRSASDLYGNTFHDRALNELAILKHLNKMGLSSDFIDYFENDKLFFIISEYIPGKRYDLLPLKQQIDFFPKLLGVLKKIHEKGVVHRDIKLKNIFHSSGKIKFFDFEISSFMGNTQCILSGTNNYMPPQNENIFIKPSYDLYSVGTCMLNILCGRDPAEYTNNQKGIDIAAKYANPEVLSIVKNLLTEPPTTRLTTSECIKELKNVENWFIVDEIPFNSKR